MSTKSVSIKPADAVPGGSSGPGTAPGDRGPAVPAVSGSGTSPDARGPAVPAVLREPGQHGVRAFLDLVRWVQGGEERPAAALAVDATQVNHAARPAAVRDSLCRLAATVAADAEGWLYALHHRAFVILFPATQAGTAMEGATMRLRQDGARLLAAHGEPTGAITVQRLHLRRDKLGRDGRFGHEAAFCSLADARNVNAWPQEVEGAP